MRTSYLAFAFLFAAPVFAADAVPVADRGLPLVNLNNVSGNSRSNVRWSWYETGLIGDDFTVGAAGETWVIDSIRTWAVPGTAQRQPDFLGDFYQDVRLYLGGGTGDLTPLAAAQLTAGSDSAGNPDVQVTPARLPGEFLYDDFGTQLRLWQVDFRNLNLTVQGGKTYRFGVWGSGRAVPDAEGETYSWYNHASNASLSGAQQDGADGAMLTIDSAGRVKGTWRPEPASWDKGSDINVQVFAHKVSATSNNASRQLR